MVSFSSWADKLCRTCSKIFYKKAPWFANSSLCNSFNGLKLQSLEHRRLINDLTFCYNIVYKCTSLAFEDYFQFSHNPSSRGHHLRLSLPLVKTNLEKSFFSWRVIKPWNALPSHIVSAATSKIFKSRLSKFDLSKFLLFPSV